MTSRMQHRNLWRQVVRNGHALFFLNVYLIYWLVNYVVVILLRVVRDKVDPVGIRT